jgi:hypothetical protein
MLIAELNGQRNSVSVANHMALAAQLGTICRIGARLLPPKSARTELPSTTARDQSMAKRNGSVQYGSSFWSYHPSMRNWPCWRQLTSASALSDRRLQQEDTARSSLKGGHSFHSQRESPLCRLMHGTRRHSLLVNDSSGSTTVQMAAS